MSNRFDYIKYDEENIIKSEALRKLCVELEENVDTLLPNSREKSLALTKLEEVFMWIGKAIRNDQIRTKKELEDENSLD